MLEGVLNRYPWKGLLYRYSYVRAVLFLHFEGGSEGVLTRYPGKVLLFLHFEGGSEGVLTRYPWNGVLL
jgi:hypothetical protein